MGELGPREWQDDGAIAIVGVACRFGGDASDEQRLWELLCDGRSAKEPSTREGSNGKEAYHLRQDPYAFDADFFGISHREARAMDPNHRMLLEVTYEALEQAGLTLDAVAGSNTNCYVGQFTDDYGHMLSRDIHGAPMYTATGSNSAISASRISSYFNFQGPSYTLNTACSSGMVALHAACESIRHEGAGMAVAASSNLILTGDMATALNSLNFLSSDGTCKTFDSSANGYARGEGVTSLILRPARAAIDAGEPIRAIIRGTGVNHNGRGERPGITVPSIGAQSTLIAKTYESAGLEYSDTNFVEAHGTGTKVGDPVEMEAIGKTIGQGRNSPLLVGSSKPNLGHTEASAGLAGIIKGVRILEHREIPPNIHLHQPNPDIKFDEWNLEVPRRLTKWPTAGLRRLSVCSTGYGGVNAHVILDDAEHYPEERGLAFSAPARLKGYSMSGKSSTAQTQDALTGARLFMIRAQDRDGLKRQATSLRDWLSRSHTGGHDSARLIRDLSHTFNNTRSSLSWTSSVAAGSLAELKDELSLTDNIDSRTQQSLSSNLSVCLVFTGQGAQWPGMGAQLYQQSSIFRSSVDAADHHLRQQLRCPWWAVEELRRPKDSSKVHKPELSQALCTIVQVALVDLLAYWRLTPKYVVGHSSGEIAAAYCLGALSREAAWEIAYFRGQLAASLDSGRDVSGSAGGMLAVGATPEAAASIIADADVVDKVVIACYNSPQNVTLSGDTSALDQLEHIFSEKGTFARRLKVGVAYHSHHMEAIAAAYFRKLRRLRPSTQTRGDVTMFSSVTGKIIQPAELGAKYFVDNLLSPVKFAPAVEGIFDHVRTTAGNQSELVFLEVGPHSALKAPLKQTVEQTCASKLMYTSLMVRGEDSAKSVLQGAGSLHALGAPFDLSHVSLNPEDNIHRPHTLTDLPSYQWNHNTSFKGLSRYMQQHEQNAHKTGALIGTRSPTLTEGHHVWRRYLKPSDMPWLFEHRIDGAALYPAAAHIISVLEAATQLTSNDKKIESFSLREVAFHAPILIPQEESIEMSVELRPHQTATRERSHAAWMAFTICSCREGSELQVNCTGLIMTDYEAAAGSAVARERKEYRKREKDAHGITAAECHDERSADGFYACLRSAAVDYGERFQMLSDIRTNQGKSTFRAHRQAWENNDHSIIHPGTLDSIIHSIFAACTGPDLALKGPMVPSLIASMHVSADVCTHGTEGEYFGSSTVERRGFLGLEGNVAVFDGASRDLSVRVGGMRMQRTGAAKSVERDFEGSRDLCCSLTWERLDDEEAPTIEAGAHFSVVCPAHPSPRVQNLADGIRAELSERGHDCVQRQWPLSPPTSRSERCIFLVDLDTSLLYDCSADDFQALQRTLSELSHVLWVAPDTASAGIPTGLARTLRNEIPSLSFRTLQVSEQSLHDANKLGNSIAWLACSKSPEMEFREAEAGLHVPRYVPDSATDKRVSDIQRNSEKVVQRPLSQADTGAVLTVQQPGDLSTLSFSPGARSDKQALGADEVDVEVRATGLNFRDLMVAIGAMPDLLMGFDASGVVTATGGKVKDMEVGDRVCVLFHGAHRSLIRSSSALVQRIPESLTYESASTLPLVLVTVYNAVVRVARAEAGQTVLVHAGAGGVGQAAIQLAQHLGLEIFTTVGSAAKRELLRTKFGLSDDHILSSRDHSFAGAIDRLTDGRGVDIVLNQLAGEFQKESWNCIAPGGTFVELGFKDIQNNASLEMRPFARDASFTFFNVARMIKEEPRVTGKLMAEAFGLLRKGVFQPVEPLTTFPIDAVEEAFRTVQSGKHVGKSALVWKPEAKVPMIFPVRDATRLRPDATYVLAGGLGAVGRSVGHLLADMGARHLCFLSRSAGDSEQARAVLDELRERGIDAFAYAADVSDANSLSRALTQVRANHVPIRGVLQLAMVLRDGLFEAATHTQWTESLRPKVQGSRNLDEAFPGTEEEDRLDFFIMLSSFGGIFGSPTQSNYAAGCAYQDALAHERRARGCTNSVSIDLGIMKGVGYFEQEQRTTGHLKQWEEPFGLDESELHAIIRLAVGGETQAQVVTGLPTSGKAREAGLERPFFLEDPRFAHLAAEDRSPSGGSAGTTTTASKGLQHDLTHAATLPAARDILTTALLDRVATSLQIPADAIQLSQPLHAYGVDSLVAVEIRSWIAKEVGVEVSTWELTGEGSLGGLVERLVGGCPYVRVEG